MIKKLVISLCLCVITIGFQNANADTLSAGVNKILASEKNPMFVGMKIQDMQTGKVLFEKNNTFLFMPASNMKLFTAAAALLFLGPDYVFPTELLTDAKNISAGTLTGNLYLKFTGDPDLQIAQLNQLFTKLSADGIKTIGGNLYIDNSLYGGKNYGPGWMWDELNICYAAPITANMINRNCFDAELKPGLKAGEMAQLQIPNEPQLTPFINQVITVNNQDTRDCPLDLTVDNDNRYKLSGCMYVKSKPIDLQIAIKNPNLYLEQLLAQLLQQNHLVVTGKVLFGVTRSGATALAVNDSEPLSILVTKMLKDSVNQIANSLLKTMGANYYHQTGNWQNGINAVQAILTQQAHLDLRNSVRVDGDGVSRYDLVTPDQLSALLNFAFHKQSIAHEFIAALPIGGTDGTLADRMKLKWMENRVRAKTGTMTGVSSLSGYVLTKKNQTLSFVILINNFSVPDKTATDLEDKLVEFLASGNYQ